MKNKIINFFYKNRIIDSHIGFWDLHIWLYFLATYFDMHILRIAIYIKGFYIFHLDFQLNKYNPKLFSLAFKIFNLGFDSDKKYYEKINRDYEKSMVEKEKAFEEFKTTLTKEELEKAIKYKELI